MHKFAVLILAAGLAVSASAQDYQDARPGDLLQVTLQQLHPTQAVLGHDQVFYKLGRFAQEPNRLFDEYCELNGQGESRQVPAAASLQRPESFTCSEAVGSRGDDMKTVVVGPDGQLFLTDGHHGFTVLQEHPDGGEQLRM